MKALSIQQPWAELIISSSKDVIKDVENRTWYSAYRGWFLVHTSKKWDEKAYDFIRNKMGIWIPERKSYVVGALVGFVKMTDCVTMHPSKWFFGPYGFVLESPHRFPSPIPWKGSLKFFDVPNATLMAKLGAAYVEKLGECLNEHPFESHFHF